MKKIGFFTVATFLLAQSRIQTNILDGPNNKVLYGDYNAIHGRDNLVGGNINQIFGNTNNVRGEQNAMIGNHNQVIGTGNFIQGNGDRIIGEGNIVLSPQALRASVPAFYPNGQRYLRALN